MSASTLSPTYQRPFLEIKQQLRNTEQTLNNKFHYSDDDWRKATFALEIIGLCWAIILSLPVIESCTRQSPLPVIENPRDSVIIISLAVITVVHIHVFLMSFNATEQRQTYTETNDEF